MSTGKSTITDNIRSSVYIHRVKDFAFGEGEYGHTRDAMTKYLFEWCGKMLMFQGCLLLVLSI